MSGLTHGSAARVKMTLNGRDEQTHKYLANGVYQA